MKRIAAAALLVLAVAAGCLAVMHRAARADPVVRRASIALPDWPRGAPAVTVVLLSDVHAGSAAMDAGRLARIVRQVSALRPDLILIAGDFVAGHERGDAARAAPILRRGLAGLRAPLGTVAVLGNHDHWTDAGAVHDALTAAGLAVVENAAVVRGPLAIGAVGDTHTRHARPGETLARLRTLPGRASC